MEYVQHGTENTTEQPLPCNAIKDGPHDERLSADEMGHLWEMYLYNARSKCQLQYLVAKARDSEIRAVLQYALEIATSRMNKLTQIFNTVGFPIPHAFNDEDVEPNAKRLFSDGLMLVYVNGLVNFELVESFMGLTRGLRVDVKEYYNACIDETQDLHKRADEVILRKGLSLKPPHFPVPDRVGYVHQDTFFGGLLGDKRPINALEVCHVYTRLQTKMLERALILGYSQVAQSKKVKALLSKGKQLIDKQIEGWSKILLDEDLPIPVTWEHEVTDSTESPFSDKLIMFSILTMMRNSATLLGISFANCVRIDIVTAFGGTLGALQAYSKAILDLMINSGWLEKIPQAANREEIIGQSH
jgi:hypothetical protein